MRWNGNKVRTVITNFEDVKAKFIVRRTKREVHNCRIPNAIKACNKFKMVLTSSTDLLLCVLVEFIEKSGIGLF